jgi:hypothetical protein
MAVHARLLELGGAVGGQASIADLVEQRPVTDAQGARRLLAVPVVGLQHLEDHFTFQFAHCLASELLE